MTCNKRLKKHRNSHGHWRVISQKTGFAHDLKLLRRFGGNKRGISSIFITIYLALIVVLLVSTLFAAQVISRSSLVEYLKNEQERRQELIQITKITTDSNDLNFISVQVNNTGAITVRIRALYVGNDFKCDPSSFEGDSYIEPKEALNIILVPPIPFEGALLNVEWTVTTERGVKSSGLGMNLWEETGGPIYTSNKFYFGPLMLLFDNFHWRSGSGPWRSGWSIPKSATDVTWRILLANVDSRPIVITDRSCFTLVGNEQQQNKIVSWFVNPEMGDLTFQPGYYYDVFFTWTAPYSAASNTVQKPNALTVGIPCINFLTFTGSFVELNGELTPFGQTIPFEGVLITDETMVTLVTAAANPGNIRNDGTSTSSVTATVSDGRGSPMANMWVDLSTSAGTLSETRVQTNAAGMISVTLTSSNSRTTAGVYVSCQGVIGTCKVNFTPATRISVTAYPTVISKNGNSTITVQILDGDILVPQYGIDITVSIGWSGNKPPVLLYQTQMAGTVIVKTDSTGKAVATLIGNGGAGTATITASASGLDSGSTVVLLENR